jgi:hypothetical protein
MYYQNQPFLASELLRNFRQLHNRANILKDVKFNKCTSLTKFGNFFEVCKTADNLNDASEVP